MVLHLTAVLLHIISLYVVILGTRSSLKLVGWMAWSYWVAFLLLFGNFVSPWTRSLREIRHRSVPLGKPASFEILLRVPIAPLVDTSVGGIIRPRPRDIFSLLAESERVSDCRSGIVPQSVIGGVVGQRPRIIFERVILCSGSLSELSSSKPFLELHHIIGSRAWNALLGLFNHFVGHKLFLFRERIVILFGRQLFRLVDILPRP